MKSRSLLITGVVGAIALLATACGGESDVARQQPAPAPPSAPAVTAVPVQVVAPGLPLAPATPLPARAAPTSTPTPSSTSAQPAVTSGFPLTVVDSNGAEVVFDEAPERIVAYDSAVVEILFAIGEGHRIVATHSFVEYPPEVADVPRVGGAFDMDVEAVVALEPDLVYVFFPTFVEGLEAAGLKVLYIETLSQDFTKIADTISLWGRIVGSPGPAEAVAADFRQRVASVRAVVGPLSGGPSVFDDLGMFWTVGPDTLEGEVFKLLKLENVGADISGYEQISAEQIVEKDPDWIFTPDAQSYFDNSAFKDISAVKNNRVVELTADLLSVSGPRFVEGIEQMAKLIYPDLF